MKNTAFNPAELVLYAVAFLLINVLGAHFQAPISYNGGLGWDGVVYHQMAEQFVNHEPVRASAPSCYRIGTPFVAALISPQNLLLGFKIVNLAANALAFGFFVIWIRWFLKDWRVRCLVALLLLTHWLSPFRWIYFNPFGTDSVHQAVLLLGLLCIPLARGRPGRVAVCLALVVFVGVVFREAAVLLAVAFLFVENPIVFTGFRQNLAAVQLRRLVRIPRVILGVPLLAGVAGIALTHLVAHKTNDYEFVQTAFEWIRHKPWPTYIHGLFITFGPMLALVLYNWRRSWQFLAANQALLVFVAGSCVLAYIGGTDTERFWYWTMPVTYVLIGKSIEDLGPLLSSTGLIVLLGVSQAIAQRLFWTTPDYPSENPSPLPLLTPMSSSGQLLDLFSYHARGLVEWVSIAEYVLLTCVIILWLNSRARRVPQSSLER